MIKLEPMACSFKICLPKWDCSNHWFINGCAAVRDAFGALVIRDVVRHKVEEIGSLPWAANLDYILRGGKEPWRACFAI